MKDANGRPMARLGDTTDHGGTVIQAAADFSHQGRAVALDGHMVKCPKCGSMYPIIASGILMHRGRRVGYIGDWTGCGARLVAA
ncbi:PAAR domain-containing protein [Paraburkholderia phosphatilytica]|uniref:PAAR domain-containing protein n=1 Tax=Paraburkholderia phosphatilytica TaxID=2282883 RepID=UPI000E52025F|nr:PAAR domain-containing protein [Paraburkholderia phosphatilytica]